MSLKLLLEFKFDILRPLRQFGGCSCRGHQSAFCTQFAHGYYRNWVQWFQIWPARPFDDLRGLQKSKWMLEVIYKLLRHTVHIWAPIRPLSRPMSPQVYMAIALLLINKPIQQIYTKCTYPDRKISLWSILRSFAKNENCPGSNTNPCWTVRDTISVSDKTRQNLQVPNQKRMEQIKTLCVCRRPTQNFLTHSTVHQNSKSIGNGRMRAVMRSDKLINCNIVVGLSHKVNKATQIMM